MSGALAPLFGVLLRRYRKAAGLTQEQLAERAYLSPFTISALERGANQTPRPDTVDLLAQALGLDAPDLAALTTAWRARPPAALQRDQEEALVAAGRPVVALVGRAHELTMLGQHLCLDGPPVLVLAGEPGIGKSRLLREVSRSAGQAGWRVLAGGCQRRGGQEPYAPLLGTLKDYIQRQERAQLRPILKGCAWLVRLLPELAQGPIEPLPDWVLPPEQERRLMFEAVGRFVTNVAGPAGTLLLLDDLQWAGADALDLLSSLVRTASAGPVRVVGAYRDTEVAPRDPLSVLLADLAQAGLALHQHVGPLEPREAGRLLDELLAAQAEIDMALRERVLQRAGGSPFFLISCARGLHTGDVQSAVADAVPWDVSQSVRQRVATLPAAAREMLNAAAVVGRVVPRDLLLDLVAQPEDAVLAALDTLCRARLMDEAGIGAYQFVHDMIREVVEADLGAARRAVLHRRVAELLERRSEPTPLALLAYHYGRSNVQDKALLYLEQAGDRAAVQYAYVTAQSYYEEWRQRLEGMEQTSDLARAREKVGTVVSKVGRFDAALEMLQQAAQGYRATSDLDGLARAMALLGEVHAAAGTPGEGVARLQPLLELLEPHGATRGLAAIYRALSRLFFAGCRYREALLAAERAVDLARAIEDEQMQAEAMWSYGMVLFPIGHVEDGLRATEEALRLAEAVHDLATVAASLLNIAVAHFLHGRLEPSRRYHDRACEAADVVGEIQTRTLAWAWRGRVAFWMGAWDQARADIERALTLSQQGEASWASTYAVFELGELCRAEGHWDEARRLWDEVLRRGERTGDARAVWWASRVLAELDLAEGHPAVARGRLVDLLEREGRDVDEAPALLPAWTWACLEEGEVAQAAARGAQASALARSRGLPLVLVDALWVQALVEMRQGHGAEAARVLEEGLALARHMPCPHAEARLLHVYGQLHAQMDEPEAAKERLEAALDIFRRLGARKDVERLEQTLTALRHAPPRAAAVPTRPSLPAWQAIVAAAPRSTRRAQADRQALAVERLRAAGSLSPRAYATALGVSVDTALRDLRAFVEQGLVQATGTTRDRRYVLADEKDGSLIHRTPP